MFNFFKNIRVLNIVATRVLSLKTLSVLDIGTKKMLLCDSEDKSNLVFKENL